MRQNVPLTERRLPWMQTRDRQSRKSAGSVGTTGIRHDRSKSVRRTAGMHKGNLSAVNLSFNRYPAMCRQTRPVRGIAHDSRQIFRSRRPRRIRDFTVPKGASSRSAGSVCDNPSTNASIIARRCLSSRACRQRCRACPFVVVSNLSKGSGVMPIPSGTLASVVSRTRLRTISRAR
jgi:hypothetical protein